MPGSHKVQQMRHPGMGTQGTHGGGVSCVWAHCIAQARATMQHIIGVSTDAGATMQTCFAGSQLMGMRAWSKVATTIAGMRNHSTRITSSYRLRDLRFHALPVVQRIQASSKVIPAARAVPGAVSTIDATG